MITVLVNGDTAFEGDETFTVELSNPTSAVIEDGEGVGTIEDVRKAKPLAAFSSGMHAEHQALKHFLRINLYQHY